ncbi:MAG: mismatch repair endonuclease MutL [Verrucomicrobiota bacterium]|jgi:DNA mismatch repair protein MutL
MPRIHVLPDILASQVAAGEVVERPSSVVKELMENSLDAGAREILIEIERGGTALIRITDDGSGMDRDDALLSLERHATSKLRNSSDLNNILTLGFRGEAIPSIASVSRFRLITRERESLDGTEIQVHGGKIIDVRAAGCAPGTMIEIKQLFYNIPARRKFLKAENTEASHVEHEIRLHALAAPTVRFRYRRDGNEVLELPAVSRKNDRLRHLLGVESASELIEIPPHHGHGFSVEGFLLPATHARKGRKHQCVFLNGRPIEDISIARGLNEGFRGGLMDGLHPTAWLWIDMDATLVDVNVHPAKREVRFHRSHELREGISAAVAHALQQQQRRNAPSQTFVAESSAKQIQPLAPAPIQFPTIPEIVARSEMSTAQWAPREMQQQLHLAETPTESGSKHTHGVAAFRQIGLLHQRFAILESHDGLVLFDPRAARERIVYERLMQAPQRGVESQGLLVPLLIELDPREVDVAMRNRDRFGTAGLELGEFGGGTLQVRSLPAFLQLADPRAFVHDVLDDLIAGGMAGPNLAYDKLARLLAKRAGLQESITENSIPPLLEELFTCDLPYCAADGRPTLTEFSLRELDRRFGYR